MRIAIGKGHNEGCQGANGLVNEVREDRLYGQAVIDAFRAAGHEVLDITPPRTLTSAQDLTYRVNKANAWGADLVISCHVNASGGCGAEVIYQANKSASKVYADKVQAGFVKLGFKNRGTYADVRGLYEIKNHKAPCIIIEPFFCDSTTDVSLYHKLGYEKLGKTIAESILGHAIDGVPSNPVAPVTPVADVKPKANADTLLIQKRMNRLRFVGANGASLTEDGISGTNTVFAIKKFQSICGITEDGIWGRLTEDCFAQINSKPLCGLKFVQRVPTRYLQFRLGVAVDGIFGSGTEGNVISFQKNNEGLTVDGIVGQASWKVLIG